jgi:hypothetical protein
MTEVDKDKSRTGASTKNNVPGKAVTADISNTTHVIMYFISK